LGWFGLQKLKIIVPSFYIAKYNSSRTVIDDGDSSHAC